MTAADRDREAFEARCKATRFNPSSSYGRVAWSFWQAALTHARAQAVEPVAWRFRWHFDGQKAPSSWMLTDTAADPRDYLEVEPLYTHPAPAQEPAAVPAGEEIEDLYSLPFDEQVERMSAVADAAKAWVNGQMRAKGRAAASVSPPAEQKVFPQDFEPAGGWPRRLGAGDIAALKDGRIGKIEDVGACTYGLRMTDGEFITVHHEAVSPPAESGELEGPAQALASAVLNYYDSAASENTRKGLFDEMVRRAKALASHTPAPQPGGEVKIKALEWEATETRRSDEDPTTEITGWEAATGFDSHYAIEIGPLDFCLTTPDRWYSQHPSEAAAKAAAQADYERRILAALSPSPSGWDAGAEAMQEAAAKELDEDGQHIAAALVRDLPLPTPPAGEG